MASALGPPHAPVAVERHARVEVVDQVVVLPQERHGPGPADDVRGAEPVLPGRRDVRPVGRVVERPGEQRDRQARGQDPEQERLAQVAMGRAPGERPRLQPDHEQELEELPPRALPPAREHDGVVVQVLRDPAQRERPARPGPRPQVGVAPRLVRVLVVLEVHVAEGDERRHEQRRGQAAGHLVDPAGARHRAVRRVVHGREGRERQGDQERHRRGLGERAAQGEGQRGAPPGQDPREERERRPGDGRRRDQLLGRARCHAPHDT